MTFYNLISASTNFWLFIHSLCSMGYHCLFKKNICIWKTKAWNEQPCCCSNFQGWSNKKEKVARENKCFKIILFPHFWMISIISTYKLFNGNNNISFSKHNLFWQIKQTEFCITVEISQFRRFSIMLNRNKFVHNFLGWTKSQGLSSFKKLLQWTPLGGITLVQTITDAINQIN